MEPQREMFGRQYANRYTQKLSIAAVRAALSLSLRQLNLCNLDCATEIQLRRGRVPLLRGLQGTHHHLHDSLWWYLLLSLLWDYFFSWVFKVQYISTYWKKMKRWSRFRLQLLLYALCPWPTSNREHSCCLPFRLWWLLLQLVIKYNHLAFARSVIQTPFVFFLYKVL